MDMMGNKAQAKLTLLDHNGCRPCHAARSRLCRCKTGWPFIQAAAGGGGRGIRLAHEPADLPAVLMQDNRLGERANVV